MLLVCFSACTCWHQVRHPLRAIAAITFYSEDDWQHVNRITDFRWKEFTHPIKRAMYHWVIWNQYIEFTADWRYRVEDADPTAICQKASLSESCDKLRFSPTATKTEPRGMPRLKVELTWDQLDKIDVGISRMVREMATRYGYDVQPMAKQKPRIKTES